MGWAPGAKERAVTRRQVILEAMAGKITWGAAAEILQMSERNMRRLRRGYEKWGFDALFDRRRRVPSLKRAPVQEVERMLRLYREKYQGFNVRHFHDFAVRDHGVRFSYSFVKKALQEAGLVRKHRARGRHRKRREPKPCRGEMLHLDGSPHQWLALCPEQRQTLIASVDDATSEVLYAQLEPAESTVTVMKALKELFERHGLPMSLYTDRASWAAFTPKAGEKVDKSKLTQVGRALKRLGIEHIVAYSPQARGRSERLNRTFQDRLVNELRVGGIREREAANRYIRERFRLQQPLCSPTRRSRDGLRSTRHFDRSRPGPLRGRLSHSRSGQHGGLRERAASDCQAAGTADLRGAARHGAPSPGRNTQRVARLAAARTLRFSREDTSPHDLGLTHRAGAPTRRIEHRGARRR